MPITSWFDFASKLVLILFIWLSLQTDHFDSKLEIKLLKIYRSIDLHIKKMSHSFSGSALLRFFSLVAFVICAQLLTVSWLNASPAQGRDLHKRSFVGLGCLGTFDKAKFARLDRVCEECYNLYREPELQGKSRMHLLPNASRRAAPSDQNLIVSLPVDRRLMSQRLFPQRRVHPMCGRSSTQKWAKKVWRHGQRALR